MKREKRNLILSWLLLAIALGFIPINDLISLLTLFIFPYIREIQKEKIIEKKFLEEHLESTKKTKLITLIFALVVLIYTLYKIIANPSSFENLPGIWTIMFIFSPICIMLVKYEIYLFKHYTESA